MPKPLPSFPDIPDAIPSIDSLVEDDVRDISHVLEDTIRLAQSKDMIPLDLDMKEFLKMFKDRLRTFFHVPFI